MSDFDEELEDDFNEGPSSDDITDDFEDPQQSTTALTREINKLRQKNEGLRQFNVRQKERYKDEVRSFLSPIIQKYKDIQSENEFLKRQIKEISQTTATLSLAKQNGENGGNGLDHETDPLKIMENNLEEKEREIAVLNKMVKSLQDESVRSKRDMAELPELRETVKAKNDKIAQLEEEKYDLVSKIEAKDSMLAKYLSQISELETNKYVIEKRLNERVGQIENGKVSDYESKLNEANTKINELNSKIDSLQKQLSDYQDTMNSLEEELDEDNYLNKTSVAGAVMAGGLATAGAMSLSKDESHDQDIEDIALEHMDDDDILNQVEDFNEESDVVEAEAYDYSKHYSDDNDLELPSDDELLAEDIELEEMTESNEYDDLDIDSSLNEEEYISDDQISSDAGEISEYQDNNDETTEDSDFQQLDEDSIVSDLDLENEFDDSEIDLDLPIDDIDLETDSDLLEGIDLNDSEDDNPLNEFDMLEDVMDEDRDTTEDRLLKKKN